MWYVYKLIDPRDNQTFYIGKGSGNRIDAHEIQARRGVCSDKCSTIRDIESAGCSVLKEKVKFFSNEQEAYDFEYSLIADNFETLTNIYCFNQTARLLKQRGAPLSQVLMANMRLIINWVELTDSGKHKVEWSGPRSDNKILSVFEGFFITVYNEVIPSLMRELAGDKKERDKLEGMLLNHGSA